MWENNRLSKLLGTRYPIIQAPMAGCSTPELAIAVSNAGGTGSLGAAMLTTNELKTKCRWIRKRTNQPFNINFFVHPKPTRNEAKEKQMQKLLLPFYKKLGVSDVPQAKDPPPPELSIVNAVFSLIPSPEIVIKSPFHPSPQESYILTV